VRQWFQGSLGAEQPASPERVGLEHLSLGLTAIGPIAEAAALGMAKVALAVVNAGGTVVVAENATLLKSGPFRRALLMAPDECYATLGYGQPAREPGLHV